MFAFTALNAHSSRSHAIVMLTITKRPAMAPNNRALGQKVKVGKLFLVDLAGSERLKKSRSTGALLSRPLLTPHLCYNTHRVVHAHGRSGPYYTLFNSAT